MNMKSRRLLNCLWSGIVAALALSSCASQPPLIAASATGGEFTYLAAGGRAYFYTDIRLSRPILDHVSIKGVDMVRTGRFLDRVDFISGAVYPSGAPQQLLLHAWREKGRVPSASALFLSTKWEKTASPTGRNYYHSKTYGLSVSTQGSHAFVSDADPFAFEPAVVTPEGLTEFRWEAILVGWLDGAGPPINNFLSAAGMPVRIPTDRILFGIYRFQESSAEAGAEAGAETVADASAEAGADAGAEAGADVGAQTDAEAGAGAETAEAVDDEKPPAGSGEPLYELRLRVETENANQAKALATLLAFVRKFTENPAITVEAEYLKTLRILLENPPSQDGSDLVIHTEPMSAEGIALLFNHFAVYSQQTTL
jgi:hypothetical protein